MAVSRTTLKGDGTRLNSNIGDGLGGASLERSGLGGQSGLLVGVGTNKLSTKEVEVVDLSRGGKAESGTVLQCEGVQGAVVYNNATGIELEASSRKTVDGKGRVSGECSRARHQGDVEGTNGEVDNTLGLEGLGRESTDEPLEEKPNSLAYTLVRDQEAEGARV